MIERDAKAKIIIKKEKKAWNDHVFATKPHHQQRAITLKKQDTQAKCQGLSRLSS